jgi:hypothetical protein
VKQQARGYATYSEFLKDNDIERAINEGSSFRSVAELNPEGGGGGSALEVPAVQAAENQAKEVDEALENAQFEFHLPADQIKAKIPQIGAPNSLLAADHVAPKEDAAQPNKVGDSADEPEPEPENDADGAGSDSDETVTDANDADSDADSHDDTDSDNEEPAIPGVGNNVTNEISEANGNTNSSDANSNSNLDGKAGIDGRAPEKYSTSGQNNSADIEKSHKGTIHPIAVKRIASERQLNVQPYFQAFAKDHRENIQKMKDSELYRTNVELCDQYIGTMKIRKPRFVSGRNNLVREYIELSVLAKLSNSPAKNMDGSSRLGLLLDTSNMDINMQNLMDAISNAKNMAVEGGGDGNVGVPAGQSAQQGVTGNIDLPVKTTKGQAHDKTKSGL